MRRLAVLAVAATLTACAQPAPAQGESARDDVLYFMTELADTLALDQALVERTLQVQLRPDDDGAATASKTAGQDSLHVRVARATAVITLSGKLPATPCLLSIGDLLDQARRAGYQVNFNEILGRKASWSLSKDGASGSGVSMSVITNPPAKSQDERAACVGYVSVGTEAENVP